MPAPQTMANTKKGNEIMKMETRAGIKKAAGLTAAGEKKLQSRTYPKPAQLSRGNLKENIGLLLLHLQNPLTQKQFRMGWQLFEVLLTQYASERPRATTSEKVGAVRLNGQR